jgi:hypothetical protein
VSTLWTWLRGFTEWFSLKLWCRRGEIFTTSLQTIDKIVVQIGEHDVETLFWVSSNLFNEFALL